eukprot:902210-Heterocapsa_arctica.AAC.1
MPIDRLAGRRGRCRARGSPTPLLVDLGAKRLLLLPDLDILLSARVPGGASLLLLLRGLLV